MIYKSNGKLLLTSEYLVLKGAKALALPVNLGQILSVEPNSKNFINWKTLELGVEIFNVNFGLPDLQILETNNSAKSEYIQKLLKASRKLNTSFLNSDTGFNIDAKIEFNMQWGLGTSSTLINNIAQWANINAFQLNNLISNGSGYDIACANEYQPIIYQLVNGQPIVQKVNFNPNFIDHLSLVYLNKKMATENNINKVLNQLNHTKAIDEINALTSNILDCKNLIEFIKLISLHEDIISKIINAVPVKTTLFNDFKGGVKSLGAWGGDFVLAASEMNFKKQQSYFNNKGYKTVIPLKKLIF